MRFIKGFSGNPKTQFKKGVAQRKGIKHTEATKKKMSKSAKGKDHPWSMGENNVNWKGGKSSRKDGYVRVRALNHPSSHADGYILEHRLIMEKHLDRKLKKWELVHHKNGIKNDNRIENLEIVFAKKHFGGVRCPYCQKDFLIK